MSHKKLGEAESTSMCGNDITSSFTYVAGLAILFAGVWAPVVLLLIVFVLLLYKKVYTEVVEALAVNGGCYTGTLNAVGKKPASVMGLLTLLSYVATAVISAKIGAEYLLRGFPVLEHYLHYIPLIKPVMSLTVMELLAFALLVNSGIKDSARVALGIFVTHMITAAAVIVCGVYYLSQNGLDTFWDNYVVTQQLFNSAAGEVVATKNDGTEILARGGVLITLFFAFSVCLLGVSGFESSANFVEEQKPGVFRKTLRNMTIAVGILNPAAAIVALISMQYVDIVSASDFLIADVAGAIGGFWLKIFVSIDAFLVLNGAVLTAYVGTSGLASRMVGDECMPGVLGRKNKNDAYPYIVWSFFCLCISILFITQGELLSLAGVYTISFLAVMTGFAISNILLGINRPKLKRTYRAPRWAVVLAGLATAAGLVGNLMIDKRNAMYFAMYFVPGVIIIGIILAKATWLRMALGVADFVHNWIRTSHDAAVQGRFGVFIRGEDRLGIDLQYIDANESGRVIIFCICEPYPTDQKAIALPDRLKALAQSLQDAGFYRKMRFEFVFLKMPFGPEAIARFSEEQNIPEHRIFIGAPENKHMFEYADLHGVRVIHG